MSVVSSSLIRRRAWEVAETVDERRGPSVEERLDRLEDKVAVQTSSRSTLVENVERLREQVDDLESQIEELEE